MLKQPLVSERPAGAVGEIQSANYRFALFSASQARDYSEARLRQAQQLRREQDAKTALASFLAASSSSSSLMISTSQPTSATLSPLSHSSPHASVLTPSHPLNAAQKVAAKKVGRAAEEEPVIPADQQTLSQEPVNNVVSSPAPAPARVAPQPDPATLPSSSTSAPAEAERMGTENAPKKRGRGKRKG